MLPLATSFLAASNCGLNNTMMWSGCARCPVTLGITLVAEMKDKSLPILWHF